jgi:hypothetical protein
MEVICHQKWHLNKDQINLLLQLKTFQVTRSIILEYPLVCFKFFYSIEIEAQFKQMLICLKKFGLLQT